MKFLFYIWITKLMSFSSCKYKIVVLWIHKILYLKIHWIKLSRLKPQSTLLGPFLELIWVTEGVLLSHVECLWNDADVSRIGWHPQLQAWRWQPNPSIYKWQWPVFLPRGQHSCNYMSIGEVRELHNRDATRQALPVKEQDENVRERMFCSLFESFFLPSFPDLCLLHPQDHAWVKEDAPCPHHAHYA